MLENLSNEKQKDTNAAALVDSNSLDDNGVDELQLLDSSEKDTSDKTETQQESKDEIENTKKLAKVLSGVIEQEFSGPIPPPNIIAGYENVVPGAADRIIKMAEQQSSHRQSMELLETKAEIRDSLLGIIFAFGLGIGCLIACIITVIMVPAAAGAICGSILGVTGIGSIVAAFLKNTRPPNK